MAWLTASEVLAVLKVQPQTLYAYVSRGRLEARPDPADPRRSLYSAEDVAALAARRARSRKASAVAADAIAWGEPVLASALTTVTRGRLYYRGRDAITLSEGATLEEAAAWFWDAPQTPHGRGRSSAAASAAASAPASVSGARASKPRGAGENATPGEAIAAPLKMRLFADLAARAGVDGPARGRAKAMLVEESWSILGTIAAAAAGAQRTDPIHLRLADAWGLDARGADLVRRALVLMLDHELNPSTFAARVAASTGAALSACALAGLSTLSGPLHGAAVSAVIKFVEESVRLGAVRAVRARLDEGRLIPGFGHNLYPDGDPRALALLGALGATPAIEKLLRAVEQEAGLKPNVDLAVAAMALVFGFGDDGAFALFALGRSVGWLGHAMEQVETGALIRPRARYIGAAPEPPT